MPTEKISAWFRENGLQILLIAVAVTATFVSAQGKAEEAIQRVEKLEAAFAEHCKWGADSKAEQDKERTELKVEVRHMIKEQSRLTGELRDVRNELSQTNQSIQRMLRIISADRLRALEGD